MLRVTVTLKMTQMMLVAQTSHSGLIIHTVPVVHRFTGDPSGLRQTHQ